ncbi:MAG TPA: hypothetical protein VII24_03795 [Pseudolabrys sp.]
MIDKLGSQGLHMANETLALPKQPPDGAPNEHDYQAFCAALSASARGRAFLAEYARRNRHADTQMLLAAFGRLEALVARHTAAPEADRIRQELRALLGAILTARPQINACAGAVKAAKLVALLELVQRRIEAIVVPVQAASPDQPGAPAMPEAPAAEAARLHLAVVEPPDEPELPIPSPASAQQPPIALVGQDRAQTKHGPEKREPVFGQDHAQTNSLRTAAIMPEVTFVGSVPPKPAAVEPAAVEPAVVEPAVVETAVVEIAVEMTIAPLESAIVEHTAAAPAARTAAALPAAVENDAPPPKPELASPPADPLAAIMALSEDERIALFT